MKSESPHLRWGGELKVKVAATARTFARTGFSMILTIETGARVMSNTGDKVKEGIHDAAEKVKDVAHNVGEKVKDARTRSPRRPRKLHTRSA